MSTINKPKSQHKRANLASIHKELRKNLELNSITEDHFKNRINAFLVSGKTIDKPDRDCPSYLPNQNTSPNKTQTDPAFDHVYELELPEPQSPL